MKFFLKKQIIRILLLINHLIHKVPIIVRIFDLFLDLHLNKYEKIKLQKHSIFLLSTNFFTRYRNKTFFSKEPETLEWIDSFKNKSVFYDIGANVGLYSIYAAKTKNCLVQAFEPCFFNTDYLVKNIYRNSLNNNINVFPVVLGNMDKTISFNTPNTMSGNALSQADFKSVSTDFPIACKYNLPSFKMDNIIHYFKLPQPDHIKIDVDGAELEILEGSRKTLKKLKSVLIEIDDVNEKKREKIKKILKDNNFKLKFQSKNELVINKTHNEIWVKNNTK